MTFSISDTELSTPQPEQLDHTEEFVGNLNRKTFYVNNPQKEGNQLAIFSFAFSIKFSLSAQKPTTI